MWPFFQHETDSDSVLAHCEVGGDVDVGAGAVPRPVDRFRIERDLDAKVFRHAVQQEARQPHLQRMFLSRTK